MDIVDLSMIGTDEESSVVDSGYDTGSQDAHGGQQAGASSSDAGAFKEAPQSPSEPSYPQPPVASSPGYISVNVQRGHQSQSSKVCEVGRTQPASSDQWFLECVFTQGGGSDWIERQCAPGTLFDTRTGNCGRFDYSSGEFLSSACERCFYEPRDQLASHTILDLSDNHSTSRMITI